jgi:hypothetical protein
MLRTAAEGMRASLESDWMRDSKPVHVAWMFERVIMLLEAEIPWCEQVAQRIEAGEGYAPMPSWPDHEGGPEPVGPSG